MTPEELQQLRQLLDLYFRTHLPDKDIFFNPVVFKSNKISFFNATAPSTQQPAITSPSGGATQDTQARAAIDSIRLALKALNLTK